MNSTPERAVAHEASASDIAWSAMPDIVCCLYGNSALAVTRSATGARRVRAHFADPDGYSGRIEQSFYAGLASLERDGQEVFYAELHYLRLEIPRSFVWEYLPSRRLLATINNPSPNSAVPAAYADARMFALVCQCLSLAEAWQNIGLFQRGTLAAFLSPALQ